jgi:predicted MPP superfamily phosphohydrolase
MFAWAGGRGRAGWELGLFAFMLGDWVMIALLPRCGRSFGPVQAQVLELAVLRTVFGLLPLRWAIPLEIAGTLLAWFAFWIEPHRLQLTHQRLHSPQLAGATPLRVLQFGDLHIEGVTARERRFVELVAAHRPDLIVFTGDFLSTSYLDDPEAHAACRWVLSQLNAPLGVLVVSGSPAVDREPTVAALLAGLPVRWLRDERIRIAHQGHTLEIAGVSCTHRPFVDAPRMREVLDHARAAGERPFTILLYHSPDLAPDAAEAGVDLMLSGHTHGGQVRLPFYGALVTASLYGKAFEAGRITLGDLTLYVSRGLGLEGTAGPRVRFLCPPEVVLWELEGATPPRAPAASPRPT